MDDQSKSLPPSVKYQLCETQRETKTKNDPSPSSASESDTMQVAGSGFVGALFVADAF